MCGKNGEFSLVHSGNFLAQAEVDNYNVLRVMRGINPFGFRWKLAPGAHQQLGGSGKIIDGSGSCEDFRSLVYEVAGL